MRVPRNRVPTENAVLTLPVTVGPAAEAAHAPVGRETLLPGRVRTPGHRRRPGAHPRSVSYRRIDGLRAPSGAPIESVPAMRMRVGDVDQPVSPSRFRSRTPLGDRRHQSSGPVDRAERSKDTVEHDLVLAHRSGIVIRPGSSNRSSARGIFPAARTSTSAAPMRMRQRVRPHPSASEIAPLGLRGPRPPGGRPSRCRAAPPFNEGAGCRATRTVIAAHQWREHEPRGMLRGLPVRLDAFPLRRGKSDADAVHRPRERRARGRCRPCFGALRRRSTGCVCEGRLRPRAPGDRARQRRAGALPMRRRARWPRLRL